MWQAELRDDGAPTATLVDAPPAPLEAPSPPRPSRADRWFPCLVFLAVAGAMIVLSVAAHAHLPLMHPHHRNVMGNRWYYAFSWWDGWWYTGIARRGYRFFSEGRQSPVAFFPAYPMLMRLVGSAVGGPLVAGIVVTVTSGLGAAVLFHRWCLRMLGARTARLAVLLLVLYPFAFYLMGAVYADALFLFAAVAAFLALEQDRPVLAGLAAAVATAARPVGLAVVLGLWILALERKGMLRRLRPDGTRARAGLTGTFRWADAGLLLAPLGMAAFCGFLWLRFGSPFAFLDTTGAPGWDQPPGFHTWFKVHWVKAMWHGPWDNGHFGHLFVNALATVVVAAFIPRVFRRLGPGYGVFVTVAVVLTAVSTKDFVGMGRYTLAAFPCFAMAADVLSRRPRLAWVTLAVSAAGLVVLTQLHARGTIVS
jgi:hypothetical protein